MKDTFRIQAEELVAKMTAQEKISQMRFDAPAIERLGIPAYNWWNECLHGVARSGAATVFPQPIGMAASFDEALLQSVADAVATEARAKYNEYRTFGDTQIYQGLTMWSPNINIFRDPRWGRGHETYGEDPVLTARMGTAFVKGLQGSGKYLKTVATLKHFAAHSGPEGVRHSFNAQVTEEDMAQTYLYAFRYCIEHAHPASVMGSYNRINGEPACASPTYLKQMLLGDWGFDGYVVSDCGAIFDIHTHHKVTSSAEESAALAVNNGCHLNCGNAYRSLYAAFEQGLVTEETITEAVTRLFTARFRLGMFADDCEYDSIPYDVVECSRHQELNLQMARKSVVLLKNDGILPLDEQCNIAVIGPNAADTSVLLGNYNGTPTQTVTLLQGILEQAGGKVRYAKGCDIFRSSDSPWAEQPLREAILAAKSADVVVLCMGLNPTMEGEEGDAFNGDSSGDKTTLDLPAVQMQLLEELRRVGTPIVFVNVSGSCVDLSVPDEACSAVMQVFYPGSLGGRAFADILFGRVSPSGRLPVTFYEDAEDLPPFADYSMKNRTYRFFSGPVVYPFGHGLSYADVTEEWLDDLTVRLTNRSGRECDYSALCFLNEPSRHLEDFRCVHLNAGKEKIVRFRTMTENE